MSPEVIAQALANRVLIGRMTIEQVPVPFKELVQAIIDESAQQ